MNVIAASVERSRNILQLLLMYLFLCMFEAHSKLPNRLNCDKLCCQMAHTEESIKCGYALKIKSSNANKIREKNLSTVQLLCLSNVFFIWFSSSFPFGFMAFCFVSADFMNWPINCSLNFNSISNTVYRPIM